MYRSAREGRVPQPRRRAGASARYARWATIGLIGAAGATPGGGSPALAVPLGADGPIAFDSRRTGDADLYVMEADGSGLRRLEGNAVGATDERPSWPPTPLRATGYASGSLYPNEAPVGAQVTFNIAPELGSPTAVTFNGVPASYTWAGGSVTAVVPAAATTGQVCIEVRPLAANPALVFRGSSTQDWGDLVDFVIPGTPPAVLAPPCGSSLVFQSDRGGDFDVWALDPGGPAGAGAPVDLLRWSGSDETAPAWSPWLGGGSPEERATPLIAFESDRDGSRDIWLLDPNRALVPGQNPSQLTSGPADDANPDWSSDGGHIAFESDRDGQKDIWVLDVTAYRDGYAGERLRKVTVDQPPSYEPTWFQYYGDEGDGTYEQIAFSGPSADAGCDLNYVEQRIESPGPGFRRPDGISTFTLPEGAAKDDSPSFSPSALTVAFQSSRGRDDDIYSMEVLTGISTRLTTDPAADRHPSWLPRFYLASASYRRPWGRVRPRGRPPVLMALASRTLRAGDSPGGCAELPNVALDASAIEVPERTSVTFRATAEDGDGRIVRYDWDLDGDGGTDTSGVEASVSQAYVTAGIYDVSVRATDDDGLSGRASLRLTVVRGGTVGGLSNGPCTIVGTPGRDVIRGSSKRDVICGLGGADTITGGGGSDDIRGGPGNDRLLGGTGADRLVGGPGADRLAGGPGADRLSGEAGHDVVAGDAGNDTASGGSGRDDVLGGTGDDRLSGDAADDRLEGNAGADRLAGGTGSDRLSGGSGRDELRGGEGADRFSARDRARDLLFGGPGRDRATVDGAMDRLVSVEVVSG